LSNSTSENFNEIYRLGEGKILKLPTSIQSISMVFGHQAWRC
jgi:hypothetical protein